MKCPFYTSVVLFIIVMIGLVVLAIAYVDTPIVLFMHEHQMRQYRLLHYMQIIPKLLVVLLPFTGLWAAYRWYKRTMSSGDQFLILAIISFVTAFMVNYLLKFLFGRFLPTTLIDENMSFIANGVYGFHFFHWGAVYQSFPSGHIAVICAVSTILWGYSSRVKWFAIVMSAIVMTGLIGCYYHFVSDVIAGALVGIGVGRAMLSCRLTLFATNGLGKSTHNRVTISE